MTLIPDLLGREFRKQSTRATFFVAVGIVLFVCPLIFAQVGTQPSTQDAADVSNAIATSGPTTTGPATVAPKDYYGIWVLAPAFVAIGLAMITRQVILALPLGILTGAVMLSVMNGIYNPAEMVKFCIENYVLGVLFPLNVNNPDQVEDTYKHLQTILFTQFIGAMIGVVEANGGTRAMVARVVHLMRTRKRGQLGALGAGCLIFFDDYANALIIGPAMRPVFDRLRLSREKLAYIVDSTSAADASLCIGTWLAAEINFLDTALSELGTNRPGFLEGMTGSTCFWSSIPYRTYAILALVMVFIIGLTGRDYGPMRKAESRALTEVPGSVRKEDDPDSSRWFLGFLPVAVLVIMAVSMLLKTGYSACIEKGIALDFSNASGFGRSIMYMLGEADSYVALIYSALAAATLAVFSTLVSRALSLADTFEAVTRGMGRVFAAQIILVLAWGLSSVSKDLQLGPVAAATLQNLVERDLFNVTLLPMAIFLTACVVSFATGTSWGTMGILCPTTVAISAHLLAPLPVDQALPLFFASIGAVLAGAVFGDHCSPVSDTTILSALATECPLDAHVRTQLPYAVTTAVVGLVGTDLLSFVLRRYQPDFFNSHWHPVYGLTIAAIGLFLFVMLIGRRPKGLVVEPAVEIGV